MQVIEPTGLTPGYGASPGRWLPEHDRVDRAELRLPALIFHDPDMAHDPAVKLASARLARPWPPCLSIHGCEDDEIMGHAMEPSFWVQALRKTGIA